MTYKLDGIETAMGRRSDDGVDWVFCPCGYAANFCAAHDMEIHEVARHALRFHYQFCPQARLKETADGDF